MSNPKYTRLLAAVLATAALACGKQEGFQAEEDARLAISFSAEEMTRATGEVEDMAVDGLSFGVFACNTGHYPYADCNPNPNFMYNEQVTYEAASTRWSYAPVKYWPNGEGNASGNSGDRPDHLTFFAYAPYSDADPSTPEGFCIPTVSDQQETGNPWITYRIHEDVASQVDLLYCAPVVDQTKPNVEGLVHFGFKHALSCAGESMLVYCSVAFSQSIVADVGSSGDKEQVILQDARALFHLTERARLSLWNSGDGPRWQALTTGDIMTDREIVYGENLGHLLFSTDSGEDAGPWESETGKGIFYIPLDVLGLAQTVTVSIDGTIVRTGSVSSSTDFHRETTIRLSDYPLTFAPGKKLSNLSISIQ